MIFDYSFAALNFYTNANNLAAISLYPYQLVESCAAQFFIMEDGYCNYFQQRPSSRGYLLTKSQVLKFNNWRDLKNKPKNDIPPNVRNWKHDNWERIWYNYLIDTNQFLVFPRKAFNTVFGEIGYNVKNTKFRFAFQVPLVHNKTVLNFSEFEESDAKYDAFYEYLNYHKYGFFDLTGNIYGTKNIKAIKSKYILVNSFQNSCIKSFAMDLKPVELNIILNHEGQELSLVECANYKPPKINQFKNYLYFNSIYNFPERSLIFKILIKKIKGKLMKTFTS